MFRANIYSFESLSPEARSGVHEGVEMVAAYMGQTVVSRELITGLPLNEYGRVAPDRVDFSELDSAVELHIMAVPLESGEEEWLGVAGLGSGCAFVNVTSRNATLMRVTAAHETAHAFGYVLLGSEQESGDGYAHCSNQDCIMQAYEQVVAHQEREQAVDWQQPSQLEDNALQATKATDEFTFCVSCIADMYTTGEQQLEDLRYDRQDNDDRILQVAWQNTV